VTGRVDQNPRFPADGTLLTRKLTELFASFGSQLNALSEGEIAAVYNARTAPPTTGKHKQGSVVRNSAPTETGTAPNTYVVYGWLCTADGEPGTWEALNVPTGVFSGGGGGGGGSSYFPSGW
jgi:hypothetical protein